MNYKSEIIDIIKQAIGKQHEVNEASTMDNTDGWDSLTFMDILIDLEIQFDVKLSTLESASLLSVEAIEKVLKNKLENA